MLYKRQFRRRACVLVAVLLAVGRALPREPRASAVLAPPDTGEQALRDALVLRARARGTPKKVRAREVELAVRALDAAWELLGDRSALRAEAAFRAGELLRTARCDARARVRFERAAACGRTTFRPRAGLELAHLHRRARRWSAALDAYEAVVFDRLSTRKQRDTAELWRARVYAESGRGREASRIWTGL